MSQPTSSTGPTNSATGANDPLNAKILQHLGDRVILKPLTRWNEAYKEFPRYVMEYLVSRYVKPEDPVAGQHKIDRILTEHYAESAKKELIKSRIKEQGHYTLIGQLTVRLDQAKDHYWANVPALAALYKLEGGKCMGRPVEWGWDRFSDCMT